MADPRAQSGKLCDEVTVAFTEEDKAWLTLALENASLKSKERGDASIKAHVIEVHEPEQKRIKALERFMYAANGIIAFILTGLGIWEARR